MVSKIFAFYGMPTSTLPGNFMWVSIWRRQGKLLCCKFMLLNWMASSGQADGDDFPLLLAVRPVEGSADFERIELADANMTIRPMNTFG
jgi:hypothetical protein